MSNTNDNSIFIQYNSSYSNNSTLTECCEELKKHNICIRGRDLNGTIMHGALDFIDYEFIEFAYELIQTIIISGCYDIIKFSVLNIWNSIRPRDSKIPFTIKVSGIPTETSSENISCKIEGTLTDEQKSMVISKTFDLANNIANDSFKLKERSKFYDAFNAHVFRIDVENELISEINIEKEVRNLSSDK